MAIVKIIHLSDLHFTGSADDVRRIKALIKDINAHQQTSNTIVCFTGDLTYSGKKEQFDLLFADFFSEISEPALIYTCPGNHDVDEALTNTADAEHADTLRSQLIYNQDKSPFGDRCPLEQYYSTHHAVTSYKHTGFFTSFGREADFDIVGINTAWLCHRREKPQTDKGFIKVDERSLDAVVDKLDRSKTRVLLMHHPVSWLEHSSQIYLTGIINKHFDIVLYGHEHEPIAQSVSSQGGDALYLQATASKANWSNGLNGYSIINIDTETKCIQINYRSYSTFRDIYFNSNDIVDGSVYYPRDKDKEFWKRELSTNPDHLVKRSIEELTKNSYKEIFDRVYPAKSKLDIEPINSNFSKIVFKNGERQPSIKQSISDCLKTEGNYKFFVGPRDSGLTVASYLAFRDVCDNIDNTNSIPVYIDLDNTAINKAYFLRKIQTHGPVYYTPSEAEVLADTGSVVFIIDSICIQQQSRLTQLRDSLESYFKKCKAYIFCSLDKRTAGFGEEGQLRLDPDRDIIYEISQLSSEDIRTMINQKASKESEQTRENLLNNAIISFKAMDEPIYPSTVSLLVDTLIQLPDFRPVNRVRLLDRYIECLLGRFTLDDVKTGHFNSSDKSNLLSYLAGRMVELKKTSISKDDLQEIIDSYSDEMMIQIPSNIVEEFSDKGILLHRNEKVTFRANSMFSYFVAKEMSRKQDVFSKITDDDQFFSYDKEIVYYGELEGVDNTVLLNKCKDYASALETVIVQQYMDNGISFEDEWNKLLSQADESEIELAEMVETVAKQEPTAEDKAWSRDQDLQSQPRRRGVGSRDTVKELEAKWLITLRIYLQLMKYSINIPGREKVEHLQALFGSLEKFAQSIAVKRDKIASHPFYSAGGILYINPLAAIDAEKSKREFRFAAPMSISDVASELMSTSQLTIPLQKLIAAGNEFQQFVVRNLLMDIPSAENVRIVSESIISDKNRALQTASLRALKTKYLDYKSTEPEHRHHTKIVEELNRRKDLNEKIDKSKLDKQILIKKTRARPLEAAL